MAASRTVVLLGPQRFEQTLGSVAASLGQDTPFATVTAGWQERERDDDELQAALGGPSANLQLFGRWQDVIARDPEFAAADRRRRDVLADLRAIYRLRLDHSVAAFRELAHRVVDPELLAMARGDAIEVIRALDGQHLDHVAEVHAEFHETWPPHERAAIREHRAAIERGIGDTGALAIAGGHVGVLVRLLHMFNVAAALGDRPVVAWSAGAMAITEVVVLFHDRAPHGPTHSEVHDVGLGLVRDVVALPHARRRLLVDDHDRMALLARRFAPRRCLVLDDGARVDCPDGTCRSPATVVDSDGTLARMAA